MVEALETTFGKEYYADKVLERIFKNNPKWGSRDRSFIAESTYEIVRWWRFLWELYGKEPSLKRKELYRLFGLWYEWRGNDLPDWEEFESVKGLDLQGRAQDLQVSVASRESFPEWFHQRATEELGEAWPPLAHALNLPAPLTIRANTLKITPEELRKKLREEEIFTRSLDWAPQALVLEKRINIFRRDSFKKGWYEVQDAGSQIIAPFLQVKPGQRVIDACAGAGGKTLHLAALLENKGSLIAMDVDARKLEELKRRTRRNGVHNVEIRPIESTKAIKRLEQSADRLLLDVPCSGTGVIKRNPDTKWKLQPEHIERTQKLQEDILSKYPSMLKPGGMLVYATCSILRSENEDQVEAFLKKNTSFELIEERRHDPSEKSDGFYMALLQKN